MTLLVLPELWAFMPEQEYKDHGQRSNDGYEDWRMLGVPLVLDLLDRLPKLLVVGVLHLVMPLPARAGVRAAALFSFYALVLWMALHLTGMVVPTLHKKEASSSVFAGRGAAGGEEQERNGDQSSHGVQYSLKF